MIILLSALNLSATNASCPDFTGSEDTEMKCDCGVMSDYFKVKVDECKGVFTFEDWWMPCIEKASWSVNGTFYSDDLNPKPYEFCGSGVYKVCLKILLIDGTVCEFCTEVKVDCPSCCDCDKVQAGLKLTHPTPCSADFELDPDLEDCIDIDNLRWDIAGTIFLGTLDPPAVSFSGPGPYTVCLKMLLADGEICAFCEDFKLEGCEDCNCEDIKKGVKIGDPVDCSVDFKLDEALKDCVKELKWTVDGNFVSSDFDPATYVFPASGTYTLCLNVVLANGKECELCWEIKVECKPCDLTCEEIKEGVNASQISNCAIQLDIKDFVLDCIKEHKWVIDGVSYLPGSYPDTYTFTTDGAHKVCLIVVLANGKECEFCWEFKTEGCADPCDITCEEFFAGVSVKQTDKCEITLDIKEDLKECIKALKWSIDGVTYIPGSYPDVYTFTTDGLHKVCLKVILTNGEECEMCWEFKTEGCKDPCDITCEEFYQGVSVVQTDKCKVEIDIKDALKECIKKIEWTVDGTVYNPASLPNTITFTTDGLHKICLTVLLTNGKECHFCWEFKTEGCEKPCDITCEEFFDGVSVTQTSKCEIVIDIKEDLQDCIDLIQWVVDGVAINVTSYPTTITLTTDGLHEICVKLQLTNGVVCDMCWKFKTEGCLDPCKLTCEEVKERIAVTQVSKCAIVLDIKEDLQDCIKKIEWTVDGVVYIPGAYPDTYTFTTDGAHTVCVTILLTSGVECKFCWDFKTEGCKDPCDLTCEELFQGFSVTQTGKCEITIDIKEELQGCFEVITWAIDQGPFNPVSYPATHTFTTDGAHEVLVKLILLNGQGCTMVWNFKTEGCEEPCDLTCDDVKEGTAVTKIDDCTVSLEIKDYILDCIKEHKWVIDGVSYLPGSYPATWTFNTDGVHSICLYVVLENGVECEICWKVKTEGCEKCDITCEEFFSGVDVVQISKCAVALHIELYLEPCIVKRQWTIDGVIYIPASDPDVYTFTTNGLHTVCLKVLLANGLTCEYCWTFYTEDCKDPCDITCEDVYNGTSVTQPSKCSVKMEIKEDLLPCIKKVSWSVNGVEVFDVPNPPLYTFPASGTYEVCLTVVLANGKECKFCWKFEASCFEPCEQDCDDVKAALNVKYPSKCSVDLGFDKKLCIKEIGWYVNGALISNDVDPDVYTFPISGVYEICVKVVLDNGVECKICWKVEVWCKCSCDAVKSNVNISVNADCKLDFWLNGLMKPCVDDIKWSVSGFPVTYVGMNPPAVQLSGSGVVVVCVKVVLIDGTVCEYCWKVEYDCDNFGGEATDRNQPTFNVLDADGIKLYPNPSNGRFTIEVESAEDARLRITDLTGKSIYTEVLGGAEGTIRKEIDISQYPSGIYNLSIDLGDRVITKRVSINKN